MVKPTEAALRKLRRKFGNAQTAGRVSRRARLGWKVIKAPGKVRPPYRLHPVDARNGKDLTPQVGGVGFTPTPRQTIHRASHAHIESLTLMQINRALVECGGTKAYAARRLGISPPTLTRLRRELLEQQAAEQNATVPSPDQMSPPDLVPPPTAPDTEHNPVTGESLESSTPPDLGPDSDEEPAPDTADDPTPCNNCPHAHAQGTVCPVSDCNCGDELDVQPGNAGGCNDKV